MRTSRIRNILGWGVFLSCTLLLAPSVFQNQDSHYRDQPLFSFSVFSDVHVTDSATPDVPTIKLKNALHDITALDPAFLIVNGDLTTHGRPADLELASGLFDQYAGEFPSYVTMGNHDYYYSWENPEWNDQKAQEQFLKTFRLDKLYYDAYHNGLHFIFLSSEQYYTQQKEFGEAARLSPEQIKWFEQTLLSSDAPTFVFLHQPVDGPLYTWGTSTIQSEELIGIAKKHPQVFWFSSHTHISPDSDTEVARDGNVLFTSTGSVWRPWDRYTSYFPGARKRGDWYMHVDPLKSQSRYVSVYKDRVEIRTRNHHTHSFSPKLLVEPLKQPLKQAATPN